MINEELFKILACPVCHGPVKNETGKIICEKCRLFFPLEDDIPVMLKEKARPLT